MPARFKADPSTDVNGIHTQLRPEPGATGRVYFSWAQADGLGVWYRISCRGNPAQRIVHKFFQRGQQ
jgi:hypothetical protein